MAAPGVSGVAMIFVSLLLFGCGGDIIEGLCELGGATTSQVIILPQEVTSSLNLKVSYNGQSYNAQLKLPAKFRFFLPCKLPL